MALEAAHIPSKECTQEKQAYHCAIINLLDHGVSHEDEDNSTLVLTVGVKANKHLIKQAVKKLHDIDVTKAKYPDKA